MANPLGPQFKADIDKAKAWGTGHIIATAAICLAVGFVLHAILFH